VSPAYLAEVSESDATGTVAAIFDDIRTVLGVPVVNLIYRHLAADERRLESTWAAIRPNLAHAATRALALSLARTADEQRVHVDPIDPGVVLRAGVSAVDCQRARATLRVYERANALNLLAARALLDGAPGLQTESKGMDGSDVGQAEILTMADPDRVDEDVRATLHTMSEALALPGEDVLIPSLYRHLASVPPLLRLLWETTGHALAGDTLAGVASVVRGRAQALIGRLPLRVDPVSDRSVRTVLERFEPAMATLLVAGRILDDAVAGSTP
jgi:hypothetical protein